MVNKYDCLLWEFSEPRRWSLLNSRREGKSTKKRPECELIDTSIDTQNKPVCGIDTLGIDLPTPIIHRPLFEQFPSELLLPKKSSL